MWIFTQYQQHMQSANQRLDSHGFLSFRSQQPHWDYHAEVQAFNARLHENFSLELLKTAFINPCYLQAEQERRKALSVDSEAVALVLKDNSKLSEKGADFTKSFLTNWCTSSLPSMPGEGVQSIVGHLCSPEVVTYVARNLGVEDLTMSAECPVPDDVLYSTFMAVIGALQESSGAERTGLFLRVKGFLDCVMSNQCLVNSGTMKHFSPG